MMVLKEADLDDERVEVPCVSTEYLVQQITGDVKFDLPAQGA